MKSKEEIIDKILNESNGSWKDIADESFDEGVKFASQLHPSPTPDVTEAVELEALAKFIREEYEPEFGNGKYWVDILDEHENPVSDKEVVTAFLNSKTKNNEQQ